MSDRDERLMHRGDEEPEPDWAERIRAARKARGDKLRGVFAAFDDEDTSPPESRAKPTESGPPAELYDHEHETPP